MKPERYFVEDYADEQAYTAGIVRKDNEAILAAEGFKALQFRHHKKGSGLVKLLRLINAVSLAFSCSKNSVVVFHFPFHAGIYKLLLGLLQWRGIATIALIIDIDGIRDKDENLLKEEMAILKKFDCLITHNIAMNKRLEHYIAIDKMVEIEIFDYPFAGKMQERNFSKSICIAGNFTKAKFVYDLNKLNQLQFFLYGAGYDTAKQKPADNIFYKGKVQPTLLPSIMEGSFGLVWDGDSIEHCDSYLLINNPHKLSLYLAAAMPVIVWKQSAVAAFVEENGLGIAVNSLLAIDEKLNDVSNEAYKKMRQNCLAIAQQLHTGFYLRQAIQNATAIIAKNKKQ